MLPSDDSALPVTGRLAGQRAVITGAARGIGAEIARIYAREGAQVFVLDIDIELANEVARSIGGHAAKVELVP